MFQLVEFYVNVINYCVFKFLNRLSKTIDKLNPIMYFDRIPRIKRNFEKHNTSLTEIVNKTWLDENTGFNIMYSTAAVTFILYLIISCIFLFIYDFFRLESFFTWEIVAIISVIPAYLIYHFAIDKNQKYILYFRKFDKKTKEIKRGYAIFSFLIILFSILMFILSFQFI
ncbi:MAG: hypothetical protein KGZ81_03540 [Flavobacteriales bacterium]|nr:hypothetical protein [Flavobacteriales bacterium]